MRPARFQLQIPARETIPARSHSSGRTASAVLHRVFFFHLLRNYVLFSELICSEMVSAGTPCFGKSTTVQRFYYNAVAKYQTFSFSLDFFHQHSRKCQPFQYYGCNGNSNNFDTIDDCKNTCQNLETDKGKNLVQNERTHLHRLFQFVMVRLL